jgi:hypothetical protein
MAAHGALWTASPVTRVGRPAPSMPRVDRLALQREDGEDAFVGLAQGRAGDKARQGLVTERAFAQGVVPLAPRPRWRRLPIRAAGAAR